MKFSSLYIAAYGFSTECASRLQTVQQPLSHSATFSFLRAGGWDDNEPSSCLHGRCCATCWVGAGVEG